MQNRILFLIPFLLAVPCGAARAQDATITLYLRAAATSAGAFNNTGTIGTQIHVFARSSRAAMYNSATNIYAPTVGTISAGGTFTVQIPRLYSSASTPGNSYTLELDWPDTMSQTATYGPFVLAPGANNYGFAGTGSTTPIDVGNNRPPNVTSLNCYPDLPDQSTQIYISWSSGLRPTDYSRTELHLAKNAGFTPSAATLVATPPWGTTSRKLTGLTPSTSYYFCVRTIDEYGATNDACSTATCTTRAGMMSGSDGGTVGDGGTLPSDDGGGPGPGGDSDAGTQPEVGSLPVGCGCSFVDTSAAPALLALAPALALLLKRRRRPRRPA